MKVKYAAAVTASIFALGGFAGQALADGNVTCTDEPHAKWQAKGNAEAAAKAEGYEIRKTLITQGGCYEVYGVKDGGLFELFYNPVDLKLVMTIRKR